MSELERLIQEHCPNGVEFKKIKEVYKRIKGTPITAGKMKEIENFIIKVVNINHLDQLRDFYLQLLLLIIHKMLKLKRNYFSFYFAFFSIKWYY